MSTFQMVETGLPLIAALVMSLLQQDQWPTAANALVALLVLTGAGVVTAYTGSQLTGHADADIGIIITATMALQSVPYFAPYFDYIRSHIFLIAPKPPTPLPTQASMTEPPTS